MQQMMPFPYNTISTDLWNSTVAWQSRDQVIEFRDENGQPYWLVSALFNERYRSDAPWNAKTGYVADYTPRYFKVAGEAGAWLCSNTEETIAAYCTDTVSAFLALKEGEN